MAWRLQALNHPLLNFRVEFQSTSCHGSLVSILGFCQHSFKRQLVLCSPYRPHISIHASLTSSIFLPSPLEIQIPHHLHLTICLSILFMSFPTSPKPSKPTSTQRKHENLDSQQLLHLRQATNPPLQFFFFFFFQWIKISWQNFQIVSFTSRWTSMDHIELHITLRLGLKDDLNSPVPNSWLINSILVWYEKCTVNSPHSEKCQTKVSGLSTGLKEFSKSPPYPLGERYY